MTNKILLNGVDIANYGMIPLQGYLSDVISMPKTNDVDCLDWYEGNTDADLTDGISFKKEREISIPLYCKDLNSYYNTFINLLLSTPYNTFKFVDINKTLTLRLSSQSKNEVWGFNNRNTFELKFIEDNCSITLLDNHIQQTVLSTDIITIDSINIGEYGFNVNKGTLSNLLSIKNTFDRLNNAIKSIKATSNDIEIKLSSTKLNVTTFFQNYYSLIYILTTPNEKTLNLAYNGKTYEMTFFYKDIKINELIIKDNKVFMIMTLVIKSLSKFDLLS
ncbi:MAG: hypothetical protein PHG18_04415 [Bacilli bacterium]|nr:hypothetical protein [Bacilli bacterium]